MEYYFVEPEVAGGWGERTIADTSVHPPAVKTLDYEFEFWLGDALLGTFPVFIVTEDLRNALTSAELTGFEFRPLFTSESEQFSELLAAGSMPVFHWLHPNGKAGHGDFGTSDDGRLVVSDRALAVLRTSGIGHATIERFRR